MSKLLKPLAIIAGIAVNVIPGIGQVVSATILSGVTLAATAATLSYVSKAIGPKTPKTSLSSLDRLNASLVPTAPRKIVFGTTAMATDIRYVEPSGTNQEYIDYIIAVAAHRVEVFDEIWLEDVKAWTSAAGTIGKYAGYLEVGTRQEGSASNVIAINGGGKWGPSRRLTGCAYVHFRIKRTGNGKKAESPFASGLPSRITIKGRGAHLYDPRRDDTVSGGSGSMRVADQTTWAFGVGSEEIGHNAALQILFFLLGWRINGKLSVGCGIPASRIDMASFQVAANLCEEAVVKAAGGTEPRYQAAGVVSEGDDPQTVLATLLTACNGRLRDAGGKLSLVVMHNDLAAAAADDGLNDDDVLSAFTWNPDPSLEQSYNIVRGRYTDPSDSSLFQLVDYPDVSLASVDGIDRILTLDLAACQWPGQAQRTVKQVLQRKQYQRSFSATFGARAWRYQVGDVVPLTFSALGFNRRLFRVDQQTVQMDGSCPMVLIEENAAIYSWDAEEASAVQAADPVRYDSLNNPVILGIDEAGDTAVWSQVSDDGGKPDDNATVGATVGVDLKDSTGSVIPLSSIFNDALALTAGGALQIDVGGGADPLTLGTIALPDLGAASDSSRRQLEDALDALGQALAALAADASTTRATLRDAGITVDAATGKVTIYGVDQNSQALSAVQIALDAVNATIQLKASTTYVDDAIAMAVIDPSQVADLGSLQSRVTTVEEDIDAIEGTLTLKAEVAAVGALADRLTADEVTIDAQAGQIALKADSTTVGDLSSRVSSAEETISALGDTSSIQRTVTATGVVAEGGLRALIAADEADRASVAAVAQVHDQIIARINQDGSADAQSRASLAAGVADANAAVVAEQNARASADLALATQITTVQASLGTTAAAVTTEAAARAGADGALSAQITSLTATVGGNTAAIASEATTRAGAVAAVASSVTALSGTVGANTGSIESLQEVVVGTGGSDVRAMLKLDANGNVSGFAATNDGMTSTFDIVADQFRIVDPDGTVGHTVFEISGGQVRIYGNLAIDGSVSWGNLLIDDLTSTGSDTDTATYNNTAPGSNMTVAGLSAVISNVKPSGSIELWVTGTLTSAHGSSGDTPVYDSYLYVVLTGSVSGTRTIGIPAPAIGGGGAGIGYHDTIDNALEGDVTITAYLHHGNSSIPSSEPGTPDQHSVHIQAVNLGVRGKWRFI